MKSWPWWPAGWWITSAIRSDWWTIPTIRFEQLSGSVCMQRGDEIIKSLSGLYGFNLIGRDLTGEIVYIIFIYEECNVTLLSRLEESIPILLLFFFWTLMNFAVVILIIFHEDSRKLLRRIVERSRVLAKLLGIISWRKWIFEKVKDQPDYLAR